MSQAGIANLGVIPPPPGSVTNIQGQDGVTVPPNGAGIIFVQGTVVAAGSTPFTTTGNAGTSTETWSIQRSQAIAATDATKVGLAAFNSSQFSVDANGFVSYTVQDLHISPFIVSPSLSNGANFTTIQAALTAANAAGGGMVWVQPGTYNENLTLFTNTQVIGAVGFSDFGGGVVINGIHTPPTTGNFLFRNVRLVSATHVFSSNAAGSSTLVVADAAVVVTSGYLFNLPNWTGGFQVWDVYSGDGTNDGFVNNTGGAVVVGFEAGVGVGSTQTMTISGVTLMEGCQIDAPSNFVTGASFTFDECQFTKGITCSNNSTGSINTSRITSGATAALTMSSSAAVNLNSCIISSSNNPAIAGAGAGTLSYSDITFISNAAFAGTLTLATRSWQPYSRAIAATDGTKVGTAAFNSAQFTVDANGFVSTSGTGIGNTITGDSGGALSPTAGNWNILGRSGSKTSGSGSTLTVNSPPFSQVGGSGTSVLNSGEFVTTTATRTLPATAGLVDGDLVIYSCTTANPLTITANTGQTIRIGTLVSSSAGTATSTAIGDSVTLRFDATAVSWRAVSVIGTWLIA